MLTCIIIVVDIPGIVALKKILRPKKAKLTTVIMLSVRQNMPVSYLFLPLTNSIFNSFFAVWGLFKCINCTLFIHHEEKIQPLPPIPRKLDL